MQSGSTQSADAIGSSLARILGSEKFEASERNRRFLKFIVEETLAGRSNRIKAYTIATVALGRGDNFDPQTDPIVRIEAHRLRRALAYYYLTDGMKDQVRIDIPKGSYVPSFQDIQAGDAPPSVDSVVESEIRRTGLPTVLVAPFEAECDQSLFPNLTRGFTRQIMAGLRRFSDIRVLGSDATFTYSVLAEGDPDAGKSHDFVLTGGCAVNGSRFSVEALLIDGRSNEVIWAEVFERELRPDNIVEMRDEVANHVVRALAQSYGVIFSRRVLEVEGRPPGQMSSYDCVVRFHQYWLTFDRPVFAQVRACLERTIVRDPKYAEAFTCLSQIYTDGARFNFVPEAEHEGLLRQAREMARRAVSLAPRSARAYHALALAYWFSGDVRSGLEEFHKALGLNPNATEIMADLGQRYALLAEWEKGVPLLEESYRRNPAQPGGYRLGLSIYHFVHERYEDALAEARKINAPHIVYGHLAEAIALAGLGRREEAMQCIASINEIDKRYFSRAVKDLLGRHVEPKLAFKIVSTIKSLGVQVQIKAVAS